MKVSITAGHGGCRHAKLPDAIFARGLLERLRLSADVPGQKART